MVISFDESRFEMKVRITKWIFIYCIFNFSLFILQIFMTVEFRGCQNEEDDIFLYVIFLQKFNFLFKKFKSDEEFRFLWVQESIWTLCVISFETFKSFNWMDVFICIGSFCQTWLKSNNCKKMVILHLLL